MFICIANTVGLRTSTIIGVVDDDGKDTMAHARNVLGIESKKMLFKMMASVCGLLGLVLRIDD